MTFLKKSRNILYAAVLAASTYFTACSDNLKEPDTVKINTSEGILEYLPSDSTLTLSARTYDNKKQATYISSLDGKIISFEQLIELDTAFTYDVYILTESLEATTKSVKMSGDKPVYTTGNEVPRQSEKGKILQEKLENIIFEMDKYMNQQITTPYKNS